MRNVEDILLECFQNVSHTEDIELVDRVDDLQKLNARYVQKWRVRLVVELTDSVKKIELYFCFLPTFPYSWPDVYFFDTSFDFLTHIGYDDRKLCLVGSNAIPFVSNPVQGIFYLIKKVKILVQENQAGLLKQDFKNEILSYWKYKYATELKPGIGYLLGTRLCKTEGAIYKVLLCENYLFFYQEDDEEAQNICQWIKETQKIGRCECEGLFTENLKLSEMPPFHITIGHLLDNLTDDEQKTLNRLIKTNVYKCAFVIFPIFTTGYYGAVQVQLRETMRFKFRESSLPPLKRFKLMPGLPLTRYCVSPYSTYRIGERTSGEQSDKREYLVAGVGSVGSNLLYFLESEQNVNFTLVDDDTMTSNNIGRHLLGFSDIHNYKVRAIGHLLRNKHPERVVREEVLNIEEYLASGKLIKTPSAVFLCMGNASADVYVIDYLRENKFYCPVFILWLEPYAIAGHMLCLNLEEDFDSLKLLDLYDKNLISSKEYQNVSRNNLFTKHEAGCGGEYTNYGGSDVVMFLSAMYPLIQKHINNSTRSIAYRWIGNLNIANEKEIKLSTQEELQKGQIQNFLL